MDKMSAEKVTLLSPATRNRHPIKLNIRLVQYDHFIQE